MPCQVIRRTDRGFGLAEALVASGLLITLAAGLAHLSAMTSRAIERAATDSVGLLLAVQKMEQLRSLAWTRGHTDMTTNLATDPPTSDGRGLRLSAKDALARSTPAYVDYLDGDGGWVGTGAQPPSGTAFVRRWSVTVSGDGRDDRRILQVVVMPLGLAVRADRALVASHEPGVAWLATVRSRE